MILAHFDRLLKMVITLSSFSNCFWRSVNGMDKKDYLLESPLVYISSGPYAEIQVLTKI